MAVDWIIDWKSKRGSELKVNFANLPDFTVGLFLAVNAGGVIEDCNYQAIKEKRERECPYARKVRLILSFIDSLVLRPGALRCLNSVGRKIMTYWLTLFLCWSQTTKNKT